MESSNEFFDKNIRDAKWREQNKMWHKCLQRYCSYGTLNQLICLDTGPLADLMDKALADKGEMEWEEVRIHDNRKEILKQ